MRSTLLLATTLALGLTMSVAADHCEGFNGQLPEVDTGPTPAGQYYADNDVCQPECVISLWVYQESNGIPGLQRGDEVRDDTCHGTIEPDTLVV